MPSFDKQTETRLVLCVKYIQRSRVGLDKRKHGGVARYVSHSLQSFLPNFLERLRDYCQCRRIKPYLRLWIASSSCKFWRWSDTAVRSNEHYPSFSQTQAKLCV